MECIYKINEILTKFVLFFSPEHFYLGSVSAPISLELNNYLKTFILTINVEKHYSFLLHLSLSWPISDN